MSISKCIDIRAEIQETYRRSLDRTGDRWRAYLEAAARFSDVAGYAPDKPLLDKLLHGAILGRDHPLMQLLDVCMPGSRPSTLAAQNVHPRKS